MDDNVIEIFYPEELKNEIYKIYSNATDITDIDAESLFITIFEKKSRIPIFIHKNKELAEILKEKVINELQVTKSSSL